MPPPPGLIFTTLNTFFIHFMFMGLLYRFRPEEEARSPDTGVQAVESRHDAGNGPGPREQKFVLTPSHPPRSMVTFYLPVPMLSVFTLFTQYLQLKARKLPPSSIFI